ncbi:hypothetical protein Tco_1414598 [Tanacetum coccineum]
MPDDEIEFVSELEVDDDDDKDDHSKHKSKLSKTDEVVVDDVIDELVDMANSQDANLNAFADNPTNSNPLVADKIDDLVPRMVVDALEERLPELLSDTLKNILLDLLKDSVKKALPKFDKRVKKTLRVEVPKIILKPLNREFNALNKMESRRVPRDIMIINAKQLQTKVEKNAADIHELVELTKKIEIKRLADLKAKKEKSKKRIQKVLSFDELRAQAEELVAYEDKRAKMLEEYNHCISFKANPLPITKISYRINNSTKEASMRIVRNHQQLNLIVYDKFVMKMLGFSKWLELHDLASKVKSKPNDQLLKNLKAKFQWVATQAGKLGIPPLLELTTFELPSNEKKTCMKRKRRAEVIQEVFVKEKIVAGGMLRNLTSPAGVVGSHRLVINETEAASNEGFTECKASTRNLNRIQFRDIIKEVKDYLKTYSSAGMDISWYVGQSVLELKHVPKYEVGKSSKQLAECSLKYGWDVSKNGRAFNVDVLHHKILDTSQLPPLRKQPRITINMECCKE